MAQDLLSLPPEILTEALTRLRQGALVVLPTETVYGLAADASSDTAVAGIFALKNRPTFNPLIAHFYDRAQLEAYVHVTPLAEKLIEAFSPGPLTLVLTKKNGAPVSDLVTAGLETLAVRLPRHPIARHVLKAFGRPLAAPSANPSETLSPTQSGHVRQAFRDAEVCPYILEGGPCQAGLESTILDARSGAPVLLRPGSLPVETLEKALGFTVLKQGEGADAPIRSPGQLKRHYAPRTPLELNVTTPRPDAAYLAFGPLTFSVSTPEKMRQLSASGNLEEAATNLFAQLRELDDLKAPLIQVAPIPQVGLGLALNDRLSRASVAES